MAFARSAGMYHVFERGSKGDTGAWLRFLFAGILFMLTYCYPWQTETDWGDDELMVRPEYPWQARKNWRGHGYFLSGDSHTYVLFNAWTHPWHAHRSIGYPALLYPFLYGNQQKLGQAIAKANKNGIAWWAGSEKPIYDIVAEIGLAEKFETVARAQRWILSLAIVVFYLALSRWFPPLFSFLALTAALWLAPPPDPQRIGTEALSCSLAWLCAAFLLFAHKARHQAPCLALASLCAALAYLVRPQMLALTGLLSLVFLYQVFLWSRKESVRGFLKSSLAFSPLLIAYGYIVWLSVTGGQLFLHTHPTVNFSSFCYFAETADAPHMPTERARKITIWFGEHKAGFIDKILHLKSDEALSSKIRITGNESPVRQRAVLSDTFVYHTGWPEIMKYFKDEKGIGGLSLLEKNILGKELTSGLRERHSGEMITSIWQNLIGALGYYSDVWHLTHLPRLSFAFNIVALSLCVWVISISNKARWPLIMMVAVHIMAILSAACGHFVIRRYVEPTEAFLLLAGMCSLWVLGCRGWTRLRPGNAGATAPV